MADEQQNDNIKQLREAADAGRKAQEEAAKLARENAMLRAGIDLDSKAGQYFAKGYDGELTADAIKAEAEDFPGAIRQTATTPPPSNEEEPKVDKTETDQRLDLASGSGTPNNPEDAKDPYHTGLDAFSNAMASGTSRENAVVQAFGPVIAAAQRGDKRVRLDLG